MMNGKNERGGALASRQRFGAALAVVGGVMLIVLMTYGIAGFDAADAERLTATRACGSVIFIGVIMYLGYKPTGAAVGAGIKERAAIILPAFAVAANNFPIAALISGDAAITAGGDVIVPLMAECFFIGLFEETAFRGVLLLSLADRFGRGRLSLFATAAISSAVFGATHLLNLFGGAGVGGTLLQVGYSTLIGGMCALILLTTGSLASCVLIHAVYDLGGGIVSRAGEGRIWTPAQIAVTAAVGAAAFAYYVIYAGGRLSRERAQRMTGAGTKTDEKKDGKSK